MPHHDLDLAERADVAVTFEAVSSLVDFYAGCPDIGFSPPLELGWDIRRQLGDQEGFGIWRELMFDYEPRLREEELLPGDQRKVVTAEQYNAALLEQWQAYSARKMHWTDLLLVDAMADAREKGWHLVADTEAILDDLARRSGAKRAILEAERKADEAAEIAAEEARNAARMENARDRVRSLERAFGESWPNPGNEAQAWYALVGMWRPGDIDDVETLLESFEEKLKTVESFRKLGAPIPKPMEPLPDHGELTAPQGDALNQFWAHLPSGKIIHEASRGLWAPSSADKHIGRVANAMQANGPGMLATTWLSQHRAVQSMGWDPASEMIIEGKILTEAGWIHAKGCRSFNTYLPPTIERKPGDVSPWLDHIRAIYPNEADHIVQWLAFKVQRPGDKINHGLVFVGAPGVGKDTIIEPVIAAIGAHNFKSISAASFFKSDFNGYLKSVLLRIDEVHDLGGESKYAFHDRTKTLLAAPPTAHQINEKHTPHYSAVNICGVILTSNHDDALYLPRDDRRHFVCTSDRTKEDFPPSHFDRLYAWFAKGGNEAIAHYLANLDLAGFSAKAPPPKTTGWQRMVAAGLAPESGDLADAIEALGNPPALTLAMLRTKPLGSDLLAALDDPKRRRNLPKRLAESGYVPVNNPDVSDRQGRWRVPSGKVSIYARRELSEAERLNGARALVSSPRSTTPPPLPPTPSRA
jgi:hypothetical protein